MSSLPCSIVQVGGFRPTGDPFASHFGLRPLGAADEAWPEAAGKPLLFVCQLNLTTAPAVPPLLHDIALITFFVDPEMGVLEKENGVDWSLRAYSSLDGLVPLTAPAHAPRIQRGFECRWEAAQDQSEDDNAARTKIGGYPSAIQSEPWWEYEEHPCAPAYCFANQQ